MNIQAKAVDDVGISDVTLHADNPSGSFNMTNIEDDIYSKDITPTVAGLLNYNVTANDTSNQTATSAQKSVKVIDTWLYGYGSGHILDVLETNDSYIMIGQKDDNGLIIKTFKNGTVSWAKEYDINGSDIFTSGTFVTPGLLVAGADNASGNPNAVILLINETNGDLINDFVFNSTNSSSGIDSLAKISDSEIIGAGLVNDKAGVFDISPTYVCTQTVPQSCAWTLRLLWAKEYNVSSSDLYSAYGTDDGYIITSGYTGSYGLVAKFDTSGNAIWTKEVEYTGVCISEATPVASTEGIIEHDGDYYVAGVGGCSLGLSPKKLLDPDILVLDSSGSLLSSKSFNLYTLPGNTIANKGEDVLVSGWDGSKLAIMDINSNLDVIWAKNYSVNANATFIKETDDNGILSAGASDTNDIYVLKTNETGVINNCQVNPDSISTGTSKLDIKQPSGSFEDVSVSSTIENPTVTQVQVTPSCVCSPSGC